MKTALKPRRKVNKLLAVGLGAVSVGLGLYFLHAIMAYQPGDAGRGDASREAGISAPEIATSNQARNISSSDLTTWQIVGITALIAIPIGAGVIYYFRKEQV
jgi:hypothetical protein